MEEKKLSEKLRDNGIFVITSEINEETTHSLIFALLDFSASNPEKEIKLYISSGSVDYLNVFAIYDVIKSLPNPISTYSIGGISDMSLVFPCLGNKGKRFALENTIFYFSEVVGVLKEGQQTDIEILAKDTMRTRIAFESILSAATGKKVDDIHKDLINGIKLTAKEAKEYGLIDEVMR